MGNKTLSLIFVIFLFAAAWYTVVQKSVQLPLKYNTNIEQARELARKEIYQKALDHYKAALQLKDDDIGIHIEIAKIYLAINDEWSFEYYCKKMMKEFPKNPEPYEILANYHKEASDYSECFKIINSAKKKHITSEQLETMESEIQYEYVTRYKTYHDVKMFNEALCPVKIKDRWGYAVSGGSLWISTNYEEVGGFVNGIAPVKKDGKVFYIDMSGEKELVPDENFDYLGNFNEAAPALQDGKYFYVNKEFEKVFGDYDYAGNFNDGYAAVKKSGKWALINSEGEQITEYVYEDIKLNEMDNCFINGVAFAKENGKYYMLNGSGEKVSQTGYDDVFPFAGSEPTAVKAGGLWGFVDINGEMIIEPRYQAARPFSNGLAAVKIDDKWGYITIDSQVVIPAIYDDAREFTGNGGAAVKTGDNWVMINLCKYMS
ncbi:MAG TPA: WG repeat-containing protein [Acetivibrio sp.]|jgi:hypothetical protein|nr:WG repeat-containing protein [Acetivibrio sp.]